MRLRSLLLALTLLPLAPAAAAPPVEGKLLDGSPVSAPAGEVVAIAFFASWCAPCRVELPALARYAAARRGRGLAVLLVSVDAGGGSGGIRAMTKGLGLPVARLDAVRLHGLRRPEALPALALVGRDGHVRFAGASPGGQPLDEAGFARLIDPLLAERAR